MVGFMIPAPMASLPEESSQKVLPYPSEYFGCFHYEIMVFLVGFFLCSQAMEDDLNHLGCTLLFMEEACVWNDVVLQVGKRMDPLLFQLAKLAGWSCMKSYDLSHR